jgi:hypothetical protein
MSALPIDVEGRVYLDCQLKRGGRTVREAVPCVVAGTALMGPTMFPSYLPKTSAAESATFTPRGWLIEFKAPPKPRRRFLKP